MPKAKGHCIFINGQSPADTDDRYARRERPGVSERGARLLPRSSRSVLRAMGKGRILAARDFFRSRKAGIDGYAGAEKLRRIGVEFCRLRCCVERSRPPFCGARFESGYA